jgi:prophage DNA circulation protein
MSEWRDRLRPASFRGVEFKVEVGSRTGGRRLAPHEFPKRDEPYTEDMGRKGRAFGVTGYLIGSDYQSQRDRLIEALEREGASQLVHPTLGQFQVSAGIYSCAERRERGGFCEVEMQFFEAGSQAPTSGREYSPAAIEEKATAATVSTVANVDQQVASMRMGR